MPHLVIQYTPQLDAETNIAQLCQTLSDTMLATLQIDEGHEVFNAVHNNLHSLFNTP